MRSLTPLVIIERQTRQIDCATVIVSYRRVALQCYPQRITLAVEQTGNDTRPTDQSMFRRYLSAKNYERASRFLFPDQYMTKKQAGEYRFKLLGVFGGIGFGCGILQAKDTSDMFSYGLIGSVLGGATGLLLPYSAPAVGIVAGREYWLQRRRARAEQEEQARIAEEKTRTTREYIKALRQENADLRAQVSPPK